MHIQKKTRSICRGTGLLLLVLTMAGALVVPTLFSHGHRARAQTAPTPLTSFRSEVGLLYIRGDDNNNLVQQSFAPDGSLELTIDGVLHSSNPQSPDFDANLAGATSATIRQVRMEGGAGFDRLSIGNHTAPAQLSIEAEDMIIVGGSLAAGGRLSLSALMIDVSGVLSAPGVFLSSTGSTRLRPGAAVTARSGESGGQVQVAAWVVVNAGQLAANGGYGGRVVIRARSVMQAGTINANGSPGNGGIVDIAFSQAFVANQASTTSADGGGAGSSGHLTINGGTSGSLFSSGNHFARGVEPEGRGGTIDLLGKEIALANATIDSSGVNGGGTIHIGGGRLGQTPDLPSARHVQVGPTTNINANALRSGNGGTIALWSTNQTAVYGAVRAQGGPVFGNGGTILVASQAEATFAGVSDVSALGGKEGELVVAP